MTQWIQNRSLLAALLMGGLATIVLISAIAYSATGYFLGQSDAANALRWSVDAILYQFLQARNAEKDFLLRDLRANAFYERGESRNLAKHEALMASVSRGLEGLRGVASGRQKELMTEVPALLKAYEDDFQKLVAAYREKGYKDWGIEGEWRKAIHDVEQHLREQGDTVLQLGYLQLRRDEKDYLLRGEDSYAQAVQADLQTLVTDIHASHNAASDQLLDDVNLYGRLFQKYQAVEEKVGKTEETGFRGEAARAALEPFLDGISSQAVADSEAARRKVTTGGAMVVVIGVGVAGLFFYVFAASMVRPIKNLGQAAASVGDGNLATRIYHESQNELGLLARGFNDMVSALSHWSARYSSRGSRSTPP